MGRPKHYYEPGRIYLITAVTYRRQPVFSVSAYAQIAHEDITFYTTKYQAQTLAHVIMPDHIHWVLRPSTDDFERFRREQQKAKSPYSHAPHRYYLSKILQDYQRHVAFTVNRLRDTRGFKVWQDGFRDDMLRTPRYVRAAIRYVIYNPVAAGLVDRPDEYPYWSGKLDYILE